MTRDQTLLIVVDVGRMKLITITLEDKVEVWVVGNSMNHSRGRVTIGITLLEVAQGRRKRVS